MPTELRVLGWAIILGVAHVLTTAVLMTQRRRRRRNAGNVEAEPNPPNGPAERAARASHNFLETFPFFAAAVLGVVLARRNDVHTAHASELYVLARATYLPLYLLGVRYLHTGVWLIATCGLIRVAAALL